MGRKFSNFCMYTTDESIALSFRSWFLNENRIKYFICSHNRGINLLSVKQRIQLYDFPVRCSYVTKNLNRFNPLVNGLNIYKVRPIN